MKDDVPEGSTPVPHADTIRPIAFDEGRTHEMRAAVWAAAYGAAFDRVTTEMKRLNIDNTTEAVLERRGTLIKARAVQIANTAVEELRK